MTTATSTALALDEASQAISDVAFNMRRSVIVSTDLFLNADDPCPQKLAFLVQHLETVQVGVSKALAAAKIAQSQLTTQEI